MIYQILINHFLAQSICITYLLLSLHARCKEKERGSPTHDSWKSTILHDGFKILYHFVVFQVEYIFRIFMCYSLVEWIERNILPFFSRKTSFHLVIIIMGFFRALNRHCVGLLSFATWVGWWTVRRRRMMIIFRIHHLGSSCYRFGCHGRYVNTAYSTRLFLSLFLLFL